MTATSCTVQTRVSVRVSPCMSWPSVARVTALPLTAMPASEVREPVDVHELFSRSMVRPSGMTSPMTGLVTPHAISSSEPFAVVSRVMV